MVTLMTTWTWGSRGEKDTPGYRERWANDVSWGASLTPVTAVMCLILAWTQIPGLTPLHYTLPQAGQRSSILMLTECGRGELCPGVGVTGRRPLAAWIPGTALASICAVPREFLKSPLIFKVLRCELYQEIFCKNPHPSRPAPLSSPV